MNHPVLRVPGIALILILLLAGCSRGPDADQAEAALQGKLNENFQSELFEIRRFRRMGSAPFNNVDSGLSGLFIYYSAELEFRRDYNLADWRGLNLGTLAYVLGATEGGVNGFKSRGNASGDILSVEGRLTYQLAEDGDWLLLDDSGGAGGGLAEGTPTMEGVGPDMALEEVRKVLERSRGPNIGAEHQVIIEEFDRAVMQIDLREAKNRGQLTLGTGPRKGTYYAFGRAFSRFAESQELPLHAYPSEGSVENASRIQAGSLDFGLVQSDVAQLLYQGWGERDVFPNDDLRTVASLWPEAVHLIALEGSGIRSMADLRGRQVAIGYRGSGTRVNALLIGISAELTGQEMPSIREIGRDEAIAQLESGDIDALFLTEAVPAPAIQALTRRRKDVLFLPIDRDVISRLADRHFTYYPMLVEARSYPGQEYPFVTMGLAAVLMTSETVADEAVTRILELLLEGGDELARSYYRAGFVTRETMRLGVDVPLHRAASRYYRSLDRKMEAKSTSATVQPAER